MRSGSRRIYDRVRLKAGHYETGYFSVNVI